ncbi:MAG: hypothetical protein ACRDSS_05790, partial [Actinocrinis sp.]
QQGPVDVHEPTTSNGRQGRTHLLRITAHEAQYASNKPENDTRVAAYHPYGGTFPVFRHLTRFDTRL